MAIESQLSRATFLLEFYKEEQDGRLSSSLYDELKTDLERGVVPPRYHALGLPKALFGKNDVHAQHVPSSPVQFQVGTVKEDSEFDLNFHAANVGELNLDCMIDHCAGPARILDSQEGDGREGDAPLAVWQFDSATSQFCVELLQARAVMLGSDLEATKVTAPRGPIDIDPNNPSHTLLTRSQSRGVVKNILELIGRAEMAEQGLMVAITGLPGIGKSWTLYYALQQILLYDNASVLFVAAEQQSASLILRNGFHIFAWTRQLTGSPNLLGRSRLWDRSDLVVLYDPPSTGAMLPENKPVKLIYTAVNSPDYFKALSGGALDGIAMRFLGPWSLGELRLGHSTLVGNISKDEQLPLMDMLRRADKVGLLPRYVVYKDKYAERLAELENAIAEQLKDPHNMDDVKSGHNALIANEKYGPLFAIVPKIIEVSEENDRDFNYEGVDWIYSKVYFTMASKYVNEKINTVKDLFEFHGA